MQHGRKFLACSHSDEFLHCAKLGIGAITELILKTLGEITEKPKPTTWVASVKALLGTFTNRRVSAANNSERDSGVSLRSLPLAALALRVGVGRG
jgi:hypothetical protein